MDVLIGVVTGQRVGLNQEGTEAGRLLQAMITDVTDVQTVEMCQAGDEHNPPTGCRLILVAAGEAYKLVVGVDDGIAPVMDVGGRRLYATDADGEAVVADFRLHPNGKAELFNGEVNLTLAPDGGVSVTNGAGSFTMSAAGAFTFHGTASHFDHPVTVDGDVTATGTVTAPNVVGSTDVSFAGKSAAGHKHGGIQPGPGQTGVPV